MYTQHSCLYPLLNSALRDHAHPENLEAFLPYLKLFLKGLNKLPLIRKQVYRGVDVDLHEEYNQLQGKVFRWWAFSSTTQRESITNVFLGQTGESTLFKIDGIGIDIAAFSAYQNESEVLLLPGTCLVLESGVMVKDNRWEFQASVWNAGEHLQKHHLNRSNAAYNICSEFDHEGRSEKIPNLTPLDGDDDGDDDGDSIQYLQYADLPHPGWEQIIQNQR